MSSPEHHHRIDYIELKADDLAAAKRFYGGAFGWQFTDWGDDYSAFEDGRLSGGIHQTPGYRAGSGPLVILYSSDLEGSEAAVVDHGGRIVTPIFAFPGGRRFHFRDPAGNILAVWSER
ncbi:MAG: VOC family protein, partial [Myxococcales bacterium]|nr:VOC family protein [Myxococcales bacterium]